jgi:hypothetical protein
VSRPSLYGIDPAVGWVEATIADARALVINAWSAQPKRVRGGATKAPAGTSNAGITRHVMAPGVTVAGATQHVADAVATGGATFRPATAPTARFAPRLAGGLAAPPVPHAAPAAPAAPDAPDARIAVDATSSFDVGKLDRLINGMEHLQLTLDAHPHSQTSPPTHGPPLFWSLKQFPEQHELLLWCAATSTHITLLRWEQQCSSG